MRFESDLRIWEDGMDAGQIASQGIKEGFEIIVAVGGDGTINRIAEVLKGTDTALGIIPMGSGNGLARHLGIPMDPRQAIRRLNQAEFRNMDLLEVSGYLACNMAGMGFDARIGQRFATASHRGFIQYIKITLKELFSYHAETYTITLDGKDHREVAFLISIANGSQWGNNAKIAPQAEPDDGEGLICIFKPFKWYQVPLLAFRLFSGTMDKSGLMRYLSFESALIKRSNAAPIHVDGEPEQAGKELVLKMHPGSLRLWL